MEYPTRPLLRFSRLRLVTYLVMGEFQAAKEEWRRIIAIITNPSNRQTVV